MPARGAVVVLGLAAATIAWGRAVAGGLRLHAYWRSSASWRVRIALALKGLAVDIVPVHLLRDGGEQHAPAYARLNPQHLVPTLEHGGQRLRQKIPPATFRRWFFVGLILLGLSMLAKTLHSVWVAG